MHLYSSSTKRTRFRPENLNGSSTRLSGKRRFTRFYFSFNVQTECPSDRQEKIVGALVLWNISNKEEREEGESIAIKLGLEIIECSGFFSKEHVQFISSVISRAQSNPFLLKIKESFPRLSRSANSKF